VRKTRLIRIVAAIGLTIATGAAALAYEPADLRAAKPEHATLSQKSITSVRAFLRLADQHADNCKANYDQCTKACNGMTSCTNQCQTNYDACMKN